MKRTRLPTVSHSRPTTAMAVLQCLSGVFFFFFASSTWCRHSMSAKKREGERERSETLWREIWARKAAKREKEREGSESADGIGGYKSLAAIIEHSRSCGFDSFQLFYSLFLINYIYIYICVCVCVYFNGIYLSIMNERCRLHFANELY